MSEQYNRSNQTHQTRNRDAGFTLIELLVVISIIAILMGILMPSLSAAKKMAQSIACSSNLRSLTIAWRMYADGNDDKLVAAETGLKNRPTWFSGQLSYTSDPVNWDTENDMTKSPLWSYVGKDPKIFKCPADMAKVTNSAGGTVKRVRSNSMSQVFGRGCWLDKTYNSQGQQVWRTYSKLSTIRNPVKTWVFVDEHPDSINDAAFANACTEASSEGTAQIIDFPANYHNGACGFSFADGHAIVHKWTGSKIRNAPLFYGANGDLQLNVPAETSWEDVRWMAENTTVKK